jgi:hypothetical protein
VTYESYVKGRLIDLVIEEAYHYGGYEPMLAVAQVIANRVKAGWQGGDWLKNIAAAPQYRGTTRPASTAPDPRDGNFRELLRKIDDVYFHVADDSNVNVEEYKALYYAELHNINRDWFLENITNDIEHHPRIATAAQLTFFA